MKYIKPPSNIIEQGTDGNPRCYQMDLLFAVWNEFLFKNHIDPLRLTGYGDNPDHECEWIFNKENGEDMKLLELVTKFSGQKGTGGTDKDIIKWPENDDSGYSSLDDFWDTSGITPPE